MSLLQIPNRTIVYFVFVVVLLIHMQNKVMTSGDSRWFLPVAVSIIEEGNIDLDEYAGRIEAEQNYGIQRVNGKHYSIFPFGTALLSLPIVLALDWFFEETLDINLVKELQTKRLERVERLIASIFVALSSVFIYLIAKRLLNNVWGPLIIVFIFAFASPVWSTASRALWQHSPSIMLLSAALCIMLWSKKMPALLLALGPILAFAYVVRPTNALSFVMLLGVVWWQSRKFFVWTLLLSLFVFVPFVALNMQIYGTFLTPYCQLGRLELGPTFVEALAGNLFSPNRGLLIFSPVFIFSFYGFYIKVCRRSLSLLDIALGATVVMHWVTISSFPHWWGGIQYRAASFYRYGSVFDIFCVTGYF